MPDFTAPTLTATDEANLETYRQVYEVLDARKDHLNCARQRGLIDEATKLSAQKEVTALMESVAEKGKALTGCAFGIWYEEYYQF